MLSVLKILPTSLIMTEKQVLEDAYTKQSDRIEYKRADQETAEQ